MDVIADLCIVPIGVGVSVSAYLAACQRILTTAGLDIQLLENIVELQIGRPVEHYTHSAVLIVFTDIGDSTKKVAVLQTGHRDQEVVGQICAAFHGLIVAVDPVSNLL